MTNENISDSDNYNVAASEFTQIQKHDEYLQEVEHNDPSFYVPPTN